MFKQVLKTLAAALIASALTSAAFADNILVVMSDEDHLDLKGGCDVVGP
jgi:hypothetical protein